LRANGVAELPPDALRATLSTALSAARLTQRNDRSAAMSRRATRGLARDERAKSQRTIVALSCIIFEFLVRCD